ncbi:MAG: hypothetical protein Q9166_001905 [cf. Caloplaca sp. 2 TL-2023]
MSFSAQLVRRKTSQQLEDHGSDGQHPAVSVTSINETPDQISFKLLPHVQGVTSLPDYEEPPLLSRNTFRVAAKSEDKLLARSFELWALTQVIISQPNDWEIYMTHSQVIPNDDRQDNARIAAKGNVGADTTSFHHVPVAQLQAAAEQGASDISKKIMVELEKRLERKEKCQGFETFFVGVILLHCAERMSWAIKRASNVGPVYDASCSYSLLWDLECADPFESGRSENLQNISWIKLHTLPSFFRNYTRCEGYLRTFGRVQGIACCIRRLRIWKLLIDGSASYVLPVQYSKNEDQQHLMQRIIDVMTFDLPPNYCLWQGEQHSLV